MSARVVRGQAGFLMIELLAAIVLMSVGILATLGVLESSRALSLVSERQETMVHRARQELERLSALPYSELSMSATPTPSASTSNPDFAVNTDGTPTYTYGGLAESLALDATNGVVPATAQSWSEGNEGGSYYDFVTYHSDGQCGSECPSSQNYKRIVVAITGAGSGPPYHPIYLSTYIVDPNAMPNAAVTNGEPLGATSTNCTNSQGQTVSCTVGLSGSAFTYFMYDTPSSSTWSAPTTSHTVHATVAPSNSSSCTGGSNVSGCPVPDLMGTAGSTQDDTASLNNYSTDLDWLGPYPGGRALAPDTTCAATPTRTDNSKGELWLGPTLSSSATLTGEGGLNLLTQTLNGASATVELCIGLYEVPASDTDLIATPPTLLGVASYQPPSWPTSMAPISLIFSFLTSGTVTVPAGHRIGLRLWITPSSTSDIAIAYDHPLFQSEVELDTQ
jgi:Tfp pilus assembly protein PilV